MRKLPRWMVVMVLGGVALGCDRTINEVRAPVSSPQIVASR